MKLKFNNFNPEEQNTNTISNDNYAVEANQYENNQYQAYAPQSAYEPDIVQPEIVEPEVVQPQISQSEYSRPSSDLFKSAMAYGHEDTSITNNKPVNDNTISNVVENKILGAKRLREYAKNDLKLKPIWALFLNYFTIVLSFSIIGVLLVAFIGTNKISIMACGLFSLIVTIISIIVLPDFVKIFLDLRRQNKYSKMFSNKSKAISLFVLLFLKSLIFTLIILIFPVLALLATKLLGASVFTIVIDALLSIVMLALVIIVAVQYALSELMCVDNKGPVQSLKESRKLMKNNMGRYIKSILPVIGWSIVASIVLSILCALPMMIIGLNQGFNSTALAMLAISIGLIACIFSIPLYSYWFMIKAEFYDNLLKKDMNTLGSKPKKTVIIGILSISLILILLSSAMLYMLPVDVYSDEFTTSFLSGEEEMVDTYALGMYLSMPKSYKVTSETDTDIYYAKNKRNTLHIKLLEDETDFEEEIDKYNAEDAVIGNIPGYKYTATGSENSATIYSFSFMYSGYKYRISGTNEEDVEKVVESIVEIGMME